MSSSVSGAAMMLADGLASAFALLLPNRSRDDQAATSGHLERRVARGEAKHR